MKEGAWEPSSGELAVKAAREAEIPVRTRTVIFALTVARTGLQT